MPACDSPHRTTGQSSCSCCKATARLRRTKPIVHVAIDVSGSLGPLRGKHWTELRDEAAKTIAAGSNWRLSTFGETDSCYDTGRPVSGNAPVSGALDERHRLARGLGNRNRTPVLRVVREHARANPDEVLILLTDLEDDCEGLTAGVPQRFQSSDRSQLIVAVYGIGAATNCTSQSGKQRTPQSGEAAKREEHARAVCNTAAQLGVDLPLDGSATSPADALNSAVSRAACRFKLDDKASRLPNPLRPFRVYAQNTTFMARHVSERIFELQPGPGDDGTCAAAPETLSIEYEVEEEDSCNDPGCRWTIDNHSRSATVDPHSPVPDGHVRLCKRDGAKTSDCSQSFVQHRITVLRDDLVCTSGKRIVECSASEQNPRKCVSGTETSICLSADAAPPSPGGWKSIEIRRVTLFPYQTTPTDGSLELDGTGVSVPGDPSYVRVRPTATMSADRSAAAGLSLGVRPFRAARAGRRLAGTPDPDGAEDSSLPYGSPYSSSRDTASAEWTSRDRFLAFLDTLELAFGVAGPKQIGVLTNEAFSVGVGGDLFEAAVTRATKAWATLNGGGQQTRRALVEQDLRVGACTDLRRSRRTDGLLCYYGVPSERRERRALRRKLRAATMKQWASLVSVAAGTSRFGPGEGASLTARCTLAYLERYKSAATRSDRQLESAMDACRAIAHKVIAGFSFAQDLVEDASGQRTRAIAAHPRFAVRIRVPRFGVKHIFPEFLAVTTQVGLDHYNRRRDGMGDTWETRGRGTGRSAASLSARIDMNLRVVALRFEASGNLHYSPDGAPDLGNGFFERTYGALGSGLDVLLPWGISVSPSMRTSVFDDRRDVRAFVGIGIAGVSLRDRYPGIMSLVDGRLGSTAAAGVGPAPSEPRRSRWADRSRSP